MKFKLYAEWEHWVGQKDHLDVMEKLEQSFWPTQYITMITKYKKWTKIKVTVLKKKKSHCLVWKVINVLI